MPIQFHCPQCGQPIEVDDDAANQPVTCPHCRRISSAPAATAPNFDPRPRPAAGPQARPSAGMPYGGPTARDASAAPIEVNKLAWWSLYLIGGALVLMIPLMVSAAIKAQNMPATTNPTQLMEAMEAQQPSHPVMKVIQALASCILPLAAGAVAVAALIRGGSPKWPAYTTLGILGAGALVFCIMISLVAAATSGGGI